MTSAHRRVGFVAAASALLGVAACGNSSKPMDDGLKKDLAAAQSGNGLAPGASAQLVISADEAGPTAAPVRTSHRPVPKPTPRPAPRLASNRSVQVQAPTPQPVVTEPAPSAPAPVMDPAPVRQVEPPPLPPANRTGQDRQKGTYKTEAEIFRQMPWIKP